MKWLRKILSISHVHLKKSSARFLLSKNVDIRCAKGSSIHVHGKTLIGFDLNSAAPYPTLRETKIILEKNAQLEFHGDAKIAPGTIIRVCRDGRFIFGGSNLIAHDCLLLCKNEMRIGKHSGLSWRCILLDDDGHNFYNKDGKPLKKIKRPLIVGDGVAFQMCVLVPAGIKIGDNVVIGAGTVLRENIPSNTLVYSAQQLKIKQNINRGLHIRPPRDSA